MTLIGEKFWRVQDFWLPQKDERLSRIAMNETLPGIGFIDVVTLVVGLFVVMSVFLGLAKWLTHLTMKPVWEKLKEHESDKKELTAKVSRLETELQETRTANEALLRQSMTDVMNEIANVSDRYAQFRQEVNGHLSGLRLDLAENYVNTEQLAREFKICRETTHGG